MRVRTGTNYQAAILLNNTYRMHESAASIYTLSQATGEIFIMLLVSFVLGALVGRLLGTTHYSAPQKKTIQALPAAPLLKKDDLKVIEGIGPRIEELLNKNGILTWTMLAKTPTDRLERILETGNGHFKMHNPKTWPDQAALATQGRWSELKAFQDVLTAGRDA